MRRKSERTKEKEKSSPEKKTEKATRRSRRQSRRRKRSVSSSTERDESGTEENETSLKSSQEDTEEEQTASVDETSCQVGAVITVDLASTSEVEEENKPVSTRSRRPKKHSESVCVEEEKPTVTDQVDSAYDNEWKEDKTFWEDESKPESSEQKHNKEKEGRSPVWTVKSADCGGGEIQKLKLCIVRPQETTETPGRKRKRLRRTSGSQPRDKSDIDDNESGKGSQEEEEKLSSDERNISSKSCVESVELEEKEENMKMCSGVERTSYSGEHNETDFDNSTAQDPDKENVGDSSVEDASATLPKSHEDSEQKSESSEANNAVGVTLLAEVTETEEITSVVEVSDEVNESVNRSSECQEESEVVEADKEDRVESSEEKVDSPTEVAEKEELTEEKECGGVAETSPRSSSPECSVIPDTADTYCIEDEGKQNSDANRCSEKDTNDEPIVLSIMPDEVVSEDVHVREEVLEVMRDSDAESKGKPEEHSDSYEPKNISSSSDDNFKVNSDKENLQESDVLKIQEGSGSSDDEKEGIKGGGSKDSSPRQFRQGSSERLSPRRQKSNTPDRSSHRALEVVSSANKHRRHFERRSRSPQRREKISLRRTFPGRKKEYHQKNGAGYSEIVEILNYQDKMDKENDGKIINESDSTADTSRVGAPRKRRWGQSNSCRPSKKPVLSISTDSLKSLIPGAKPVPIGEVQLVQEDEVKKEPDLWESEREVEKEMLRSDEREELLPDKKVAMLLPDAPRISVAVTDDNQGKIVTRKISIVSDDARTLQKSPSPPRHRATNILFITNLVRPFTINQLKELLLRTGKIIEGGFWIDKIKSKCYVEYEKETEAKETRHALHGVRWPVSNPKTLSVDFGKKEDMELAQAVAESDQIPRKTEPLKVERTVEGWVADQVREKDREREMRERMREAERERERDRERMRGKERTQNAPAEVEHNKKVVVREWDLGKIGQASPGEREPRYDEKREKERKIRKEKGRHSRSISPHEPAVRKIKKKEEDAPAKLLDDLFRKTKTTPCIYWLPLTAEQIVVKEEMRRKHMAEHERRMAEMRKAERERERVRAQQRQQRRVNEREKRRRRSASGSPKK